METMKTLSNRSGISRQLIYQVSAAPCIAIMAFLCFTLLSAAVLDARPLPVNERHSSFGYGQMLASPFPKDDPAADFPRLPSGVNGRFGNEQRAASSFSSNEPAPEFPRLPSVVKHSDFDGSFGNEQTIGSKFPQNEPALDFPRLPSVVKHTEFEKWSPFTANKPAPDAMTANGVLPARYSDGEEVVLHPDYQGATTNPVDPHYGDIGEDIGFHARFHGFHGFPGFPGFTPCC